MFTGIVQGIAEVVTIREEINFRTIIVKIPQVLLPGLKPGASVANNGCCLTITRINGNHISFDLTKETLCITNLGDLQLGDVVNIERAAKLTDEIGGHFMSGHIITTAEICKIINSKNNHEIWFRPEDSSLLKYIFYKGYIGVDGISLTICNLTETEFCVHLIPETLLRTTLVSKTLGHRVNIEIDSHAQLIVNTIERILTQHKHHRYLIR